jgi:hypothetical protein
MHPLNNLDRFFFYILIPTLTIYALWGSRHYFRSKQPYYKQNKKQSTVQHIININIILGIIGHTFITLLYFYILSTEKIQALKWEIITLASLIFISFTLGIGIGSHLTTLSIKTVIPRLLDPRFKNFTQTLNYFHYPFSHKFMYVSTLLALYVLTVLDIFQGKMLDLNYFYQGLAVICGIIMGSVGGVLTIITKSSSAVLKTCFIILISLFFLSINESRNITLHGVALLLTTFFATIFIGLVIAKQSKINLRPLIKRLVKYWLRWDINQI